MVSQCPACGAATAAFAVPADLRALAPSEAERAAICTRCLRTVAVDAPPEGGPAATPETADFSAIHPAFPDGEGGVAFALACGLLGSLALNRAAIQTLLDRAEREGVDVFLTLDRLAAADSDPETSLSPHFDVHRRRTQVEQLL